jgi:hypothetical protein
MSKEVFRKYAELFSTPLGKEVLEDLQDIWKSAPAGLELSALAHLEGQRHVVRYIEQQIAKGIKEK